MTGDNGRHRLGLVEAAVLLVCVVLGVIGLTILGLVWSPTEPPRVPPSLGFRIPVSVVAVLFVVLGLGMPMAAWWRRSVSESHLREKPTPEAIAEPAENYRCPGCGASLDARQEVSPGGVTRCRHCQQRWNVHRRGSKGVTPE